MRKPHRARMRYIQLWSGAIRRAQMQQFIHAGVDGIITDNPGELAKLLGE